MAGNDERAEIIGRYGAPEVLVYDSRTAAGESIRKLLACLPGVAKVVRARHVAGMAGGPPAEAVTHGLPMYIRFDPERRSYEMLHGVDAAHMLLRRAHELSGGGSAPSGRFAPRAGKTVLATMNEVREAIDRVELKLERERDDVTAGYLWALPGSDFEPDVAQIAERRSAVRSAGNAFVSFCRTLADDAPHPDSAPV